MLLERRRDANIKTIALLVDIIVVVVILITTMIPTIVELCGVGGEIPVAPVVPEHIPAKS